MHPPVADPADPADPADLIHRQVVALLFRPPSERLGRQPHQLRWPIGWSHTDT
jgi:hypothetical protein